jgi:hypothetical protein
VTFPAAPLIETVTDWYCPSCALTEQTVNKDNRFHHCPKLRMVSPLVRAGVHAKIERHMRQDYIGNEQVRRDDDGQPVMNLTITRDDGQDVFVFAPTATARGKSQ